MNYHVFVVDENTLKYHLEYLFAGTGAKQHSVPFILNPRDTTIHHLTERSLFGLISDISRVREGDKIIFYLQSSSRNQGRFYGVFEAVENAFFDEFDGYQFLKSELKKSLTFRIKIEPDEVYAKGLTEHDFLDSLKDITYPHQMCWSLIYRKLKGNRGCTMITEHEYLLFESKLKEANKNKSINLVSNTSLSFDNQKREIITTNNKNSYSGRKDNLNIKSRLIYKAQNGQAFETHLQAYILQNFDKGDLKKLLLRTNSCWIGNEVSCGAGMQRIDLLLIEKENNNVYIRLIELKSVKAEAYIATSQLPWYIQWLKDYIVPNYLKDNNVVHLTPTVIATGANEQFLEKAREFSDNDTNNLEIEPLEFVSLSVEQDCLKFTKII